MGLTPREGTYRIAASEICNLNWIVTHHFKLLGFFYFNYLPLCVLF